MKLFLILTVVTLAFSSTLVFEAQRAHGHGRAYLSHSRAILQAWNHQHGQLRRHDLSSYQQIPLGTTHEGFTLNLKVHGLNYKMSMDTGSADIFIKGQKSPGVPKKKYKCRQNYKKKYEQVSIGYLDGSMSTYATVLDVQFDGKTFDVPLLVAYTAPKQFEDVEGLIGLSYPQIARHQPTFIQTLIKNNIINRYAYGMNLNLIQDNRSFVTFGQKDTSLYEGEMIYYPIGKSKEIRIDFNWIKIGNSQELNVDQALLDTGNTCISIPHKYQDQILNAFKTTNNLCSFEVEENVPMFSLLICKVKNLDELPPLTLNIAGNEYKIEKQFYLQECLNNPAESKDIYYCETYIQSSKHSDETIFLGDGFFNRFYTYFDLENEQVGIAKNRQNITMTDIKKLGSASAYDPEDWKSLQQQTE